MPAISGFSFSAMLSRFQQPGPHDAACPPDFGHLVHVEREFVFLFQDREALAYACIMPYSMPLCTILTKCPEPRRPDAPPAFVLRGRQRF